MRGISIYCHPRSTRFTLVIDSEDYFIRHFSGHYEIDREKKYVQFKLYQILREPEASSNHKGIQKLRDSNFITKKLKNNVQKTQSIKFTAYKYIKPIMFTFSSCKSTKDFLICLILDPKENSIVTKKFALIYWIRLDGFYTRQTPFDYEQQMTYKIEVAENVNFEQGFEVFNWVENTVIVLGVEKNGVTKPRIVKLNAQRYIKKVKTRNRQESETGKKEFMNYSLNLRLNKWMDFNRAFNGEEYLTLPEVPEKKSNLKPLIWVSLTLIFAAIIFISMIKILVNKKDEYRKARKMSQQLKKKEDSIQ